MTQEEFFKRYKYDVVDDRIGGGGFGTVYKAYDTTLHREVAIKVSEVKTANGKTFSLRDEVEALTHVPEHPNIANYEKEKLFTFKTPQGVFDYAVMQYYPDGNLSNAIKEGLTDAQKEDIATQLLEGIGFLHQHKVVHRDLKPGNILVVRDGGKVIPLITDFGLSKAASTGDGSVFTNSFGGGTPRYSSPEQLQGQPLRFNTDLWSFGAILYEVFTGEQLFSPGSGASNTAQADLEIFNKIVNGDVKSLGRMPEKWRKVAERCLVVDPGKRAKSAEELFFILKDDEEETEVNTGLGVPAKGSQTGEETSPNSASSGGKKTSKGEKTDPRSSEPAAAASKSQRPAPATPKPVSTSPKEEPFQGGGSKKGLWIGLAAIAAVVVLAVLLLKPRKEVVTPDTQAYNACQTVQDYRRYISDYGRNSEHYADAKKRVDDFMADSTSKAQQQLAQQQAQQQAAAEAKAKAEAEKKEDAAYQKCTTISACDSYLKTYPNGRYVTEVKAKKAELEEKTKNDAEAKAKAEAEKKEDAAYQKCTTISTCDSYLKTYPNGRYVTEVKAKKAELEKMAQQQAQQQTQQASQGGNGSANGHAYVDLGLPSGTLWATCNMGASKPEGYGNYYAWGETGTKNTYDWSTYKYANGGNDMLTKYCNNSSYGNNGFTDNLTTLQSGDDPATSWGSGWRTPSKEQWDELLKHTTNKWTTQNGVKGRLFTAKNGQTLFLPAAGYRWGSELGYAGSGGHFWSRSLYTGNPNRAWSLYFDSDDCDMNSNYRRNGFSVRPVLQN